MTQATTTTQTDRPAEFQAALDAYILGYRRYYRTLRRPARPVKISVSSFLRIARSWVPALGQS